jgi:gluconate 2-dehydrogenase
VSGARKAVLVFRELPPDQLARITALHEVTLANPRKPEQKAAFEAALPQAQGLIGWDVHGKTLWASSASAASARRSARRAALDSGRLRAAGLDVFAVEPLPLDSPLRRHPRVTALPHVGSATHETRYAMARMATDNLLRALAGERPLAVYGG